MKNSKLLLAPVGAIMLLTGCSKNNPGSETEHPTQAGITVTADWSDLGKGVTKPALWLVKAGNYSATTSDDRHIIPDLFDPGTYNIILYNELAELSVSGDVATLQTATAPQGGQGTYFNPQPGWLWAGTLEATVVADKDYELTVPMRQRVRELTLIITPEGGATDKVEGITASLSGVAGAWNLTSDQPTGEAGNIALTFSPITEGDNAGSWTATVRLLGISGPEQKLTGNVTFDGIADIALESDLSGDLSTFNDKKGTPLTLDGQLVQTPDPAGFTCTITGWNPLPAKDVNAN